MQPVYNLSTVGADLATNLKFSCSACWGKRPGAAARTVVVGLDFESFLLEPAKCSRPRPKQSNRHPPMTRVRCRPTQSRSRLAGVHTDRWTPWRTACPQLWANRRGSVTLDLQADGRLTEGHLRRWTAADGVALLFEQKNRLTVRRYKQMPRHVLSHDPAVPVRDFAGLDALVSLGAGPQH
jgi:hypothetical protein